jgi:inner membrane protein
MSNNQLSIRFLIVAGLVLAMLIPLFFVGGVAEERQHYFARAGHEVSKSWGGKQCVNGPFLVIPVIHNYQIDDDGQVEFGGKRLHRVLLPDSLHINVQLDHQFRRRAIYDIPVYRADLDITGSFTMPALDELIGRDDNVLLDEARLVFGVANTQAISQAEPLSWSGAAAEWEAGSGETWVNNGIHASLPALTPGSNVEFSFRISLKGSETFSVLPVGGQSTISMASTWPSPSFQGRYLPDDHTTTDSGFAAQWSIHELARSLPDSWTVERDSPEMGTGYATVYLHDPISAYHVIERGIKYGLLFVTLTYLTFICFELSTPIRFHYVQYGVVGLGLVLFYLALLSLSEHMSFIGAYLIATGLLTALISWYVHVMSHSRRLALIVFGVILSLYVVLYTLLKLEAFSLLAGTGLLLVGLGALMYATRGLGELQDDDATQAPGVS